MDEKEVNFSLSYEQLLQEAEAQIKKCDLNKTGEHYVAEWLKARAFMSFWHTLALKGYPGTPDIERIDADWARLEALASNGNNAA
ncbi:hypothetical protein NTH58_004022 [Enterobacter oligotrophicus]|nr:hypothetical protein [Enterobacter oligotrophicus]